MNIEWTGQNTNGAEKKGMEEGKEGWGSKGERRGRRKEEEGREAAE